MITVITQPLAYSPLNAAIYKVTSDRPGIIQFLITVYDADAATVISRQKYSVMPMLTNGISFDIASILSSFVDYELYASGFVIELNNLLKRYQVSVTELYRDIDEEIIAGDTLLLPSDFRIFNGYVASNEFISFIPDKYVNGLSATKAKFLNNKPLTSRTYLDTKNYLYFMSAVASKVRVKIYRRSGVLINTYDSATFPPGAYRALVSPETLAAIFGADIFTIAGDEFTDEFTPPFGSQTNGEDITYYTVEIINELGGNMSEVRTFIYASKPCAKILDLIFTNDLGGYDTLTFYNPKQEVAVERGMIESNPLQLNSDGDLLYTTPGDSSVFNPDTVIISTSKNSVFTASTDVLKDDFKVFAKDLIESKNVFVKLSDGILYPVLVQENNYTIKSRKYSTDNDRQSISFKIKDTNIKL